MATELHQLHPNALATLAGDEMTHPAPYMLAYLVAHPGARDRDDRMRGNLNDTLAKLATELDRPCSPAR